MACLVCGPGQTCSAAQACWWDPASVWRVAPQSATIAPTDLGSDWDVDGSPPDVVVQLFCPSSATSVTSSTEEVQSFQPSWVLGECTMSASELTSLGFAFRVLDVDTVIDDQITPELTVTVTQDQLSRGLVEIAPVSGLTGLRIALRRN